MILSALFWRYRKRIIPFIKHHYLGAARAAPAAAPAVVSAAPTVEPESKLERGETHDRSHALLLSVHGVYASC